jgi:hypothetical protein
LIVDGMAALRVANAIKQLSNLRLSLGCKKWALGSLNQ